MLPRSLCSVENLIDVPTIQPSPCPCVHIGSNILPFSNRQLAVIYWRRTCVKGKVTYSSNSRIRMAIKFCGSLTSSIEKIINLLTNISCV
jgi:hypothetical protein